jgi:hypothetical protein
LDEPLGKRPHNVVSQGFPKGGVSKELGIVGQAVEFHRPDPSPTGETRVDGEEKRIDEKEKEENGDRKQKQNSCCPDPTTVCTNCLHAMLLITNPCCRQDDGSTQIF